MTISVATASKSLTEAPALIVFGRDDGGKPHASWFGKDDEVKAERAAAMMGMASLGVAADAVRDLAGRLPRGKVFPSGKAFVPFVKGTLYDVLATHLPADYAWPERQPVKRAEGEGEDGGTGPDGGAASSTTDMPVRPTPKHPEHWSKIEIGNMVLATEGPGEGWFEARVVKIKGDGLYTLRWRDWIDIPEFVRRRVDIALIHPKHTD